MRHRGSSIPWEGRCRLDRGRQGAVRDGLGLSPAASLKNAKPRVSHHPRQLGKQAALAAAVLAFEQDEPVPPGRRLFEQRLQDVELSLSALEARAVKLAERLLVGREPLAPVLAGAIFPEA